MQLIGMLDSPYVRRVAISLRLLGIPFEHRALSVFRDFDEFRTINPVVKAPTMVCDDGTVLMDSCLMLDLAERIAPPGRSLLPVEAAELPRALRIVGLALAACEKGIAIVYERQLRPADRRHQPWIDRVTGQLLDACAALDREIAATRPSLSAGSTLQHAVTPAVAWSFFRFVIPDVVAGADFPHLRDFAAEAEKLAEFVATPLPAEFTSPKE